LIKIKPTLHRASHHPRPMRAGLRTQYASGSLRSSQDEPHDDT
jgi:hypothetical protein